MLVLNRKVGESIIIDDEIEVIILEVKDGKVKLGIEADESITILRKEVYDEVREENTRSIEEDNSLDILKMMKNKRK